MVWLKPAAVPFVHREIGAFDIAYGSVGVEQRSPQSAIGQPAPEVPRLLRIGSDRHRPRLVFREASGDELWHPQRVQKAGADPSWKSFAQAGEDRQIRTQGVDSRRMGIVGKRVEKQIGLPLSGNMVGCVRHSPGKNETL